MAKLHAVLRIQAVQRGRAGRRDAAAVSSKALARDRRRDRGVTALQSAHRGARSRAQTEGLFAARRVQNAHAARLQAQVRGRQARQRTGALMENHIESTIGVSGFLWKLPGEAGGQRHRRWFFFDRLDVEVEVM